MIVDGTQESTTWVAHGSQKDVFYSVKVKAKLCEVIETEKTNLPTGCAFCGHGKSQHAGGGWKGNRGLQYYLYLISEGVDLQDAVAIAYGSSMQCDVQNKREVHLGDVVFRISLMRSGVLRVTCLGIRSL